MYTEPQIVTRTPRIDFQLFKKISRLNMKLDKDYTMRSRVNDWLSENKQVHWDASFLNTSDVTK